MAALVIRLSSFPGQTTDRLPLFFLPSSTHPSCIPLCLIFRRHIGGQLPEIIEVRNPTLDTVVKIEVPNITTVENDKMFTRSNIIRLCIESLHNVSDWKEIVERQVNGGKVLELAWRIDTNLDWIWLETDMYGLERPWTVLCGLALRQVRRCSFPSQLRILTRFVCRLISRFV